MGKTSNALVPITRSPRAIARRDAQPDIVGGGLVKWAVANNMSPIDLAKAVEREAARTTDIRDLAARIGGHDPTMGAPFAAWDDNRLNAGQMGPGAPASPFPLGGEPRQYQYRVGWNFPSPPDSTRGIDSQLLRVLADSFDLVRLCIEIRKSDLTQLEWDVVPREKNRSKREEWLKENADELEQVKQFFAWPEAYVAQDAAGHWVRRGKVKWEDWLGSLVEDLFVGDWLTIWPRVMRNGNLLALDRVDGSTIKPLLDLDGRIPEPPTPAYQQYLYGVPRASFTLEDLLYRPRTVRNHTPYGFSHVEQMLVLINLALRFQMWNTQGYTDGALPLGLLVFPDGYGPDQIQAVVDTLNAAVSGLAGARQQFHGVPYGTDWKDLKPFQFDETFAQYVVEYTAAMFRLNAQKLGFMPGRGGQGLGGKGFAEQQARNDEDKSTVPDARWVEALMNEIIERYFNRADIEFVFTDLADGDAKMQAESDQTELFAGLKSLDQILQERGEDPVGVDRFVVIGNIPWSISDLKAIQDPEGDGKDYERQPAPGIPIFDDGTEDPPPDGGVPGGGPQLPSDGPAGPGVSSSPPRAPGPPGQEDEHQGLEPREHRAAREPASGSSEDVTQHKPGERDDAKKFDTSSGMGPRPSLSPRGTRADIDELRRWKRMAVKTVRSGRRVRPFVTTLLPETVKTMVADQLTNAQDVIDVRVIFDRQIAALEKRYVTIDEAKAAGAQATVAGLCVRAADTGRILMLQRSISDDTDPARGTWEFPGGHLEDGEQPLEGAVREWQEETGIELPPGTLAGSFRNGIYECFVYVIGSEQDMPINLATDDRLVINPDDPDGDDTETLAWWAPSDARHNPALREECADGTDWAAIGRAVPDAQFKLAGVLLELRKDANPQDDDSEREQRIKQLAAAAAADVAMHAASLYGAKVQLGKHTDDAVNRLQDHYRQAVLAGSRDAATAHGVAELSSAQVDAIAAGRAEAQRENVRGLIKTVTNGGDVPARAVGALARGAKPAYEEAFGRTMMDSGPVQAIWRTKAADPCGPCADRDGEVFAPEDLPGWPGDGDFGGELCEGGPNDRCEIEWRPVPGTDAAEFAAAGELEKIAPPPSPGEELLHRAVGALEKLADRPPDEHHHHVKIEQPPRGPVRIDKGKDGSVRLVPEDS